MCLQSFRTYSSVEDHRRYQLALVDGQALFLDSQADEIHIEDCFRNYNRSTIEQNITRRIEDKMKNLIPVLVILISVSIVYGDKCSGGPGAIWGAHADGNKSDYFGPGEAIYLDGQNLNPTSTYHYTVTDQDYPEPDKPIVAEGDVNTDENGDIIVVQIWTIPGDDYPDHAYRINLEYNYCDDNIFTKKDSLETIPEFPTAALPAIITLGGYLAMRIRRT
jgi:hypothetical protein